MPGPQNRAITELASTAVVYSLQFTRDPLNAAGPIQAFIYGTVNLSDGTVKTLSQAPFALTGGLETSVRGLMDGQALTRMRTVEGIEAP